MYEVGKHTRLTPEQRQASLCRFVERVKGSEDAQMILDGWGLQMDKSTVKLRVSRSVVAR